MSGRPTPETDDLARGNHVVPTEWAEQLERERDEAREALGISIETFREIQAATWKTVGELRGMARKCFEKIKLKEDK